ncbi:MAG: pantoate--beta-alanine ligase [Chloroflexota bacterium]|nr:MAG: pantoate--beta-alanine ligase [Chloroflexota bacterium]
MRTITSTRAIQLWRDAEAGSVGFVPTMGYLHQGHLTLVRKAAAENDAVVVSIFVNPLQFGPSEDFGRYPRDLESDQALLAGEHAHVVVFNPTPEEMYPSGFSTAVEVEGSITQILEGAKRPGHFRGVTTVVNKLFNLVRPTRAYFGEKDAQQLAVIRKMVSDLAMNLTIVGVPTVREPDGLAMSSRNVYLSPTERQAALVLSRALAHARSLWQDGERSAPRLGSAMLDLIAREPLAKVDYVSVADPTTLQEIEGTAESALVSMAVFIGRTRLIDNTTLRS